LWFVIEGLGYRIYVAEFRVQNFALRVWGLR